MPVDTSALNAAIDTLVVQATKTETTEDSAAIIIAGFATQVTAAVTAALTADTAANQGSIDAANAAIAQVTARFAAADDKLGAAIVANTPGGPPVEPPVV